MDKALRPRVKEFFGRLTQNKTRFFKWYPLFMIVFVVAVPFFGHLLLGEDFEPILFLFIPIWSIFCLIGFYLLLVWFRRYRPMKRRIARILETQGDAGLEGLLEEMLPAFPKKQPFFGTQFLYIRRSGLLLAYGDITWIYYQQVTSKVYGITVNTARTMMLGAADGRINPVVLSEEELKIIAAKNPSVIFGYDDRRKALYKQLVRENKEALKAKRQQDQT